MSIRVLLVDDLIEARRLVRTALRFRGDFTVVGEAASGHEAVALAAELRPDVVVLDIGLPDLAGHDVLSGIRSGAPAAQVVVFSGTDPEHAGGIAERVEGYVLKDADIDYLVDLLEALSGKRVIEATTSLPGALASASEARAFVRDTLRGWNLLSLVDDAQLVVTELVANAITHAGTQCELRLSMNRTALRVEVVDYGGGTPDPMPPSLTRNHGRGLHLIDALTAAWGVEPASAGGKMVWAELMRNGEPEPQDVLTT